MTKVFISISDCVHLLNEIQAKKTKSRERRLYLELLVSKLAFVYQLTMKAYEYLSAFDEILRERYRVKSLNKKYSQETPLGIIKAKRDKWFHEGRDIVSSECNYGFATISGDSFLGIRIVSGGKLRTPNHVFMATNDEEFALTSSGLFRIQFPRTSEERWELIEDENVGITMKFDELVDVAGKCLADLREIWEDISEDMRRGDGKYAINFLNEGGSWKITARTLYGLTQYIANEKQIIIQGDLTIPG